VTITELRGSIPWNVFAVPFVVAAIFALISGVTAFTLHSIFRTVTQRNAELSVIAFTVYGFFTGTYFGWRNAYKLWRARQERE